MNININSSTENHKNEIISTANNTIREVTMDTQIHDADDKISENNTNTENQAKFNVDTIKPETEEKYIKINDSDNEDQNGNTETEFDSHKGENGNKNDIEFARNDEDNSPGQGNMIILGSIVPKASLSHSERRRRCRRELESLGAAELMYKNEYDVFTDDNKIYKKYRLRKTRKPEKPSINVPASPTLTKPRKEEPLTCNLCNQIVFTKIGLRTHLRSAHNFKYTCSLCSKTFMTNNKLVAHKAIHDCDNRSFICHKCKVAFSNQYDYLLHQATHKKHNNMYKCPECGLSYDKFFAKHLATHFNMSITCTICDIQISREKYSSHIKSHNNTIKSHNNTNKYQCVECKRVLKDRSAYDLHMALHTGVKLHQCLYCGKGFRTSQTRNKHTALHTDDKPFKCEKCDKRYIQRTDLDRHMLTVHDRVKNFECDICNKKYLQKIALQSHRRVHFNDMLYKCPECSKQFATMSGLKAHVLFVHTNVRPIECKACNKRFLNRSKYGQHALTNLHKNNVYKMSLENK